MAQSPSTISLEQCYDLAIKNDPLNEKKELLAQATALKIANLDTYNKPNFSWNAQASVQSENVKLPFEIPGVEPFELPLVRAQTTIEAAYALTDWGRVDFQKQIEQANLLVQQQQIDVQLRSYKEQINRFFLGVLLLKNQEQILLNGLETVETKVPPMEAAIRNGVLLESELARVQVEILKIKAKIVSVQQEQLSALAVLSDLIGQELPADVQLKLPNLDDFSFEVVVNRPELELFSLQKQAILAHENLLTIKNKPQFGTFLQAGVGYPNPLNLFDNTVSPFAILGAKMTWNFWDWGRTERERELLSVQTQIVDNQKAVFERNVGLMDGKFQQDVKRMEALIEKDKEIEALQESILTQLSTQLDHGVITASDYLVQAKAVREAQLTLKSRLTQLQQIKIDYLTTKR